MQTKSEGIITAQLAILADIADRLPAYRHGCEQLSQALARITNHKWISRYLAHARLNVVKAYGSDLETVDFKSVNDYPIFRKDRAGDKRLSNIPSPLSQSGCLDIRELFLEAGRRLLPAKSAIVRLECSELSESKTLSINPPFDLPYKPIAHFYKPTDPNRLDFSGDPHGKDSIYRKAVKRAIQLFHEQCTMENCVRVASKETGYKVKARINRGFRAQLNPEELAYRIMSAKAAHGYLTGSVKKSDCFIFRELKTNENHLAEICRS